MMRVQELRASVVMKRTFEEEIMNTSERRFALDWLRVGVILTVFVYHSTRFFNLGGWHVKNAVLYWSVDIGQQVLETWMMPLCFVVSGAAVFYALNKTSAGVFIKDKLLRLLVPLVVGIFTHSAWQVYLERVSHGEFGGSFLEFYPHYFQGAYGLGGNFGWMGIHLWYVEMLFVFSLVFLPLFLLLRCRIGRRLLGGVGRVLAVPGAAFVLVVPLILILESVPTDGPLGMDPFGGWSILSHAWFFISGYLIASSERMQQSIQRLRWVWLTAAIVLTITQVDYVIKNPYDMKQTPLMAYLWILSFLGLAGRYLNFNAPGLQRANEAALPFYILHQPVLLSVGFFVLQWAIPDVMKWAIIATSSFVISVGLYEVLVRRFNLLRFLFGMKMLPRVLQPAGQLGLAQAVK